MQKNGSINITIASPQDVPDIVRLLSALYRELGEEAGSLEFLDEMLVKNILGSGQTDIYLVRDNHMPVGILTLTGSQAIYAGGRYGTIDEMFISPQYRANGIGEKLVEYIIAVARQRAWKRIVVTAPTDEKWKRTVKFYEKCGFAFTGPKLKLEL